MAAANALVAQLSEDPVTIRLALGAGEAPATARFALSACPVCSFSMRSASAWGLAAFVASVPGGAAGVLAGPVGRIPGNGTTLISSRFWSRSGGSNWVVNSTV